MMQMTSEKVEKTPNKIYRTVKFKIVGVQIYFFFFHSCNTNFRLVKLRFLMSFNLVFETKRLIFRNFTIDDAALIYHLNKDPEVVRYTLDPMHSLQQAHEVLEKIILPQYALYNYGRWAVHEKSDLNFLGWCGLKYRPELNEIDLGYRYQKKAWGKGYATEAAYASLEYGFSKLRLNRIVGRALPENLASIRVLEKCEMQYLGEDFIEGYLHKTYEKIAN